MDTANEVYSHRWDDLESYKKYKQLVQNKMADKAYQDSLSENLSLSHSLSSQYYQLVIATTFIDTNVSIMMEFYRSQLKRMKFNRILCVRLLLWVHKCVSLFLLHQIDIVNSLVILLIL